MATYGSVTINIESQTNSQQDHTVKQTVGKRLTQHTVIGADTKDNVLDINGSFNGSTAANLQSLRNSLENLNDGKKHTWSDSVDSRYDGDYVIEDLSFDRQIDQKHVKFGMRLIEW